MDGKSGFVCASLVVRRSELSRDAVRTANTKHKRRITKHKTQKQKTRKCRQTQLTPHSNLDWKVASLQLRGGREVHCLTNLLARSVLINKANWREKQLLWQSQKRELGLRFCRPQNCSRDTRNSTGAKSTKQLSKSKQTNKRTSLHYLLIGARTELAFFNAKTVFFLSSKAKRKLISSLICLRESRAQVESRSN